MQHADQVAYLERMLRMVRTNTRDDGPGVSHTSVEEYYDPARFRREVDLLFRHHPMVYGAVLVLVLMLAPQGILGFVRQRFPRRARSVDGVQRRRERPAHRRDY